MMLPSNCQEELCEETDCVKKCLVDETILNNQTEAYITLHALSSNSGNNTIRVLGMVSGKILRILIDSDSINNFLDPQAAKMVKASLIQTPPIVVSIVDGFKVTSSQQYKGLKWSIQGEEFSTDFRILPSEGIDVVLGVQWLKLFSLITFDFNEL